MKMRRIARGRLKGNKERLDDHSHFISFHSASRTVFLDNQHRREGGSVTADLTVYAMLLRVLWSSEIQIRILKRRRFALQIWVMMVTVEQEYLPAFRNVQIPSSNLSALSRSHIERD